MTSLPNVFAAANIPAVNLLSHSVSYILINLTAKQTCCIFAYKTASAAAAVYWLLSTSPLSTPPRRHTTRCLLLWLTFLPFGLWHHFGAGVVPITGLIGLLLLGIEEIGVQIEEVGRCGRRAPWLPAPAVLGDPAIQPARPAAPLPGSVRPAEPVEPGPGAADLRRPSTHTLRSPLASCRWTPCARA